MADGFGARVSGFAREHRNAILYSVFGAAVFIASLAATFPYAATLTALLYLSSVLPLLLAAEKMALELL